MLQDMDIQMENVRNVQLELIHHQEVHLLVNNVVQHRGLMLELHLVQYVQDVLLVVRHQILVPNVKLDIN